MKSAVKSFLSLTLVSCLLSSCIHNEYSCQRQALPLAFIGFTPSEIDTVIVRQYQKGSSFDTVLDSAVVGSAGNGLNVIYTSGDTLISDLATSQVRIYHDADYEIVIPATGQIYRLSDITAEQKTQKTSRSIFGSAPPITCENRNLTISVDGVGRTLSCTDGKSLECAALLVR